MSVSDASSKPGSKNHDASNELRGSSLLNLELKLGLKGGCWEGRLGASLPANHQWCRAASLHVKQLVITLKAGRERLCSEKQGSLISRFFLIWFKCVVWAQQDLHRRSLGSPGGSWQEVTAAQGWFIALGWGASNRACALLQVGCCSLLPNQELGLCQYEAVLKWRENKVTCSHSQSSFQQQAAAVSLGSGIYLVWGPTDCQWNVGFIHTAFKSEPVTLHGLSG